MRSKDRRHRWRPKEEGKGEDEEEEEQEEEQEEEEEEEEKEKEKKKKTKTKGASSELLSEHEPRNQPQIFGTWYVAKLQDKYTQVCSVCSYAHTNVNIQAGRRHRVS